MINNSKVLLRLNVIFGGEGVICPDGKSFLRELSLPFNPILLLLNGSRVGLSLQNEKYAGSIVPCPNVTSVTWQENIGQYKILAEIVFQKKEDFDFITKKITRDERYKQC